MSRLEEELAARTAHATNIGFIVLALAGHEVGDYGDCMINDPVTAIVDREEPALRPRSI